MLRATVAFSPAGRKGTRDVRAPRAFESPLRFVRLLFEGYDILTTMRRWIGTKERNSAENRKRQEDRLLLRRDRVFLVARDAQRDLSNLDEDVADGVPQCRVDFADERVRHKRVQSRKLRLELWDQRVSA